MLSLSPQARFALALGGLLAGLVLLPASPGRAQSHAGHAHAQKPAATAQAPLSGPVEELYKQRQYEAALRKADELRGSKQVTADNEYWAARSLRVMKRYDEAADRFRRLSKEFPGSDQAASADVDALIAILGKMPEGHHEAKDRKLATDTGVELLAVAKKHSTGHTDMAARAYYIAGNAFRMGHDDERASTAYQACRDMIGDPAAVETGYPDKCTMGLASVKARTWQEEEALALYRDCSLQDRDANTSRRCAKSLSRMELVGHAAPELKLETWINEGPTTLAANRGKVVMLFFFATWCPHCKATLPTLPRYLEKYSGQPFELMALTNNAKGQTTESASLFVKDPQWKISYPVGVDANGATTVALEASGIPQVILIDKKGVVRWSDHPAYLKDEMIEALLAEPGGA